MSTDSFKKPAHLINVPNALRGTSQIPAFSLASPSYQLVTIAHNQPFIPIVDIYVSGYLINFNTLSPVSSAYTPLPIFEHNSIASYVFPVDGDPSTLYALSILFAVDATNIYVEAYHDTPVSVTLAAIPILYYIKLDSPT